MPVILICISYAVNENLSHTAPSAAVLMSGTTSVTSTTINITGSVPSGTVVTEFEVRWQRDPSVGCSDEDEDTISETGAFPNSYQISGLEPGNRYTITVTVSNAAGSAPASNSVTETTLETGERVLPIHNVAVMIYFACISTAPSAGPASVTFGAITSNSIRVLWEAVPCLHRNGEITGYILETYTGEMTVDTKVINGSNVRAATVSGLDPTPSYIVSVAAVNRADTGPVTTSMNFEIEGEIFFSSEK